MPLRSHARRRVGFFSANSCGHRAIPLLATANTKQKTQEITSPFHKEIQTPFHLGNPLVPGIQVFSLLKVLEQRTGTARQSFEHEFSVTSDGHWMNRLYTLRQTSTAHEHARCRALKRAGHVQWAPGDVRGTPLKLFIHSLRTSSTESIRGSYSLGLIFDRVLQGCGHRAAERDAVAHFATPRSYDLRTVNEEGIDL